LSCSPVLLTPELYSPSALRATACENTTLTVSCYEQDVIRIINAHYGRLDNNTCDVNIGAADTECLVSGTRDVVYARSVVDFSRLSSQASDNPASFRLNYVH